MQNWILLNCLPQNGRPGVHRPSGPHRRTRGPCSVCPGVGQLYSTSSPTGWDSGGGAMGSRKPCRFTTIWPACGRPGQPQPKNKIILFFRVFVYSLVSNSGVTEKKRLKMSFLFYLKINFDQDIKMSTYWFESFKAGSRGSSKIILDPRPRF